MFAIGDKIVYPMHGAGIIAGIEEKVILGESREYYIVDVTSEDMQIMVPVDTSDLVGVRPIVDNAAVDAALEVLKAASGDMDPNWNRRYRENMEKIKTGEISKVAEVVRDLVRSEQVKKLSAGEKKLMQNAYQILLGEIVLVKNISKQEAEKLIDEAI